MKIQEALQEVQAGIIPRIRGLRAASIIDESSGIVYFPLYTSLDGPTVLRTHVLTFDNHAIRRHKVDQLPAHNHYLVSWLGDYLRGLYLKD